MLLTEELRQEMDLECQICEVILVEVKQQRILQESGLRITQRQSISERIPICQQDVRSQYRNAMPL
jgi:hypothetical protein